MLTLGPSNQSSQIEVVLNSEVIAEPLYKDTLSLEIVLYIEFRVEPLYKGHTQEAAEIKSSVTSLMKSPHKSRPTIIASIESCCCLHGDYFLRYHNHPQDLLTQQVCAWGM